MSYEDLIFSCRKLVALDDVFDELLSMYNKHIKTDLGICRACDVLKFCHANGKACEEYEEI